jgi:hypothetical protein
LDGEDLRHQAIETRKELLAKLLHGSLLLRPFEKNVKTQPVSEIKFLGVWDTVERAHEETSNSGDN